MMRLLDVELLYPEHGNYLTRVRRTQLDHWDGPESLNMNAAHRIVAGLLPIDLATHLNLYPECVHEKDVFGDTPLIRSVKCETWRP
jgi:hypothetical protein